MSESGLREAHGIVEVVWAADSTLGSTADIAVLPDRWIGPLRLTETPW